MLNIREEGFTQKVSVRAEAPNPASNARDISGSRTVRRQVIERIHEYRN
jgi:hypothetical protein